MVILMQLAMAFGVWTTAEGVTLADRPDAIAGGGEHNTQALGRVLYDKYFLLVPTGGLILLVAMVGAIVLTLRHRDYVKRQDVLAQMYRDPATRRWS